MYFEFGYCTLATGLVVDDGIVVTENIFSRVEGRGTHLLLEAAIRKVPMKFFFCRYFHFELPLQRCFCRLYSSGVAGGCSGNLGL